MRNRHILLFFSLILLCLSNHDIHAGHMDKNEKLVVHKITERSFIRNWIVAGPFPNPEMNKVIVDGNNRFGFYHDYLARLNGEKNAALADQQKIVWKNKQDSAETTLAHFQTAEENGVINFEKIYGRIDDKVAYAYCEIYSEKEQPVHFLLGSDDGAKIWLNGELVHSIFGGRGLIFAEDKFNAVLKKGNNRLLVKITQWVREWAFTLEALDALGYKKYLQQQKEKEDFIAFLDTDLKMADANRWNTFFTTGEFPEIVWDRPYLVEKAVGSFPLSVKWYDKDLKEVKTAENPGRYAYLAEGISPKGIRIRRSKTVYCMPWDWIAWAERPKARLENLPMDFIDREAWAEREKAIAEFSGRMILLSILDQEEGAILMSYLDEMEPLAKVAEITDTPLIKDHEYHLALKRKILGVEEKYPKLNLPSISKGNDSAILKPGSESEAGIKQGTRKQLLKICNEWYAQSSEPFNIYIARNGTTVIDAAFGERRDGKISTQTTSGIASITKLLTGLLFAQFVDQGLINIDDPVGKYLPDLPVAGDKAITLRHCFTHTSGLWSHEEWGGVHNPWLENVIANTLQYVPVGHIYEYNGMGHNLAGKVMEVVSGKSIFKLFQENFFIPLGLKNTVLEEDLAFSCNTNAQELAVIAQLLLNRGSYGNKKFFSGETFKKIVPVPLNNYYPAVSGEQGIGLTWMRSYHPRAGEDGFADDATLLSKNVIGHGSATASIFMVDLDNNLVITQTRRRAGTMYNKYLQKLLLALEEGIEGI